MATLDEIVVKLKADVTQFKKGFRSAQGIVKKFSETSRRGFNLLGTRMAALRRTVLSLRAAFASLGLVLLGGSFIKAASAVEQYRVVLGSTLGSTREGNRLFNEMASLASNVAFEFNDIMNAAVALSGTMEGGVDEIKRWMPLILDLATVTRLSVQDTTSQIIRMYSAGAASADRFRDLGTLQMLGFEAGVSTSAKRTRIQLIKAWEDPASKFANASDKMAQTWTGLLSMMSDTWFVFKLEVADRGLFDGAKLAVKDLTDFMRSNMNENVRTTSNAIEGIISFGFMASRAVAQVIDTMRPIWKTMRDGFNSVADFWNGLPTPLKTMGIIGVFFLGLTGGAALVAAVSFIEGINKKLGEQFAFYQKILDFRNKALASIGEALQTGFEGGLGGVIEKLLPTGNPAESAVAAVEAYERGFRGQLENMKNMRLLKDFWERTYGEGAAAARAGGAKIDKELRTQLEKLREQLRTPEEILIDQLASLDKMQKELGEAAGLYADLFERARAEAKRTFEESSVAMQAFGDLADRIGENLEDAFLNALSGIKGGFKELAVSALKELTRIIFRIAVLQPLADRLAQSLRSMGGGGGGLLSKLGGFIGTALGTGSVGPASTAGNLSVNNAAFASFKIGGFQHGTSNAKAGAPMVVGERRPEIFVPSTSGRIEPKVGGGGTVTYNIDARGAEVGVEMRIRAALQETENRAVARSVAAVSDERGRGGGFAAAFDTAA